MRSRFAWRPGWVVVVGAVVASVALACSGAVAPTDEPTAAPPAASTTTATPDPTPAQSTIGAQGGEIHHSSGAVLIVPPGALAQPVAITLTETPAPDASQVGFLPVGPAFEAGPDGTTFQKPVELRLPYEPALVPSGAMLGARMAPHASNEFESLPATVDPTARFVTVHPSHFTTFVAAADLGPGDDDAGEDAGLIDAGPSDDAGPANDAGAEDAGAADAADAGPVDAGAPLTITSSTTLPTLVINYPYNVQLVAAGGKKPYTWSKVFPGLLTGLTITSSGVLSGGVGASPATFPIDLVVTDANGTMVQQKFFVTAVNANLKPTISGLTPPRVPQGSPDTVIIVGGAGFVPTSEVTGLTLVGKTEYLNASSLRVTVAASNFTLATGKHLAVVNPPPGGGTSAPFLLPVTAP